MTADIMKNRSTLALVATLWLSGCATVDHIVETPDEWVSHAKVAKFGVRTDETTINRPLSQTLAGISEYAAKCFNGKFIKKTQFVGGQVQGGTNQFTSAVNHANNGLDYFFVQVRPVNNLPYPSMPKNGYFYFGSEISGDHKQTKIVSYYGGTADYYLPPLKQWANGNKTQCPEL